MMLKLRSILTRFYSLSYAREKNAIPSVQKQTERLDGEGEERKYSAESGDNKLMIIVRCCKGTRRGAVSGSLQLPLLLSGLCCPSSLNNKVGWG